MRRIVYLMIILGWGGTPTAFAQHSAPLPDKLGYHSVNVSGEEKVQIMVSKILDGLEKGDPYIYTGLLAETYQEIPAAKDDLTGYYLTKSNHRQGVVSMLNSRAAFIDKVTRQQYDENELLYYSDRDYLLQGDAVDCSIEARTADGEMRGAIRLFFSKTAHGWQLTMSDGLSILAGWKMKLPTPKSASSEHLLYRVEDIGNTDSRTFSQARLAPEHGINVLTKTIAQKRLDRQLFKMPSGAALFAYAEALDGAPFFKSSYVQIVSDPGWNRLIYGDYQKWLKSYDAEETGMALHRPLGIAVDARGVVYVADAGNRRVVVLKLTGPADDLDMLYLGTIGESTLSQPTELAWDDRGTVGDAVDDLLWVLDQGANRLLAFNTNLASKKLVVDYKDENLNAATALAIGHYDGTSNGQIYVADQATRSVRRLYFDGITVSETAVWHAAKELVATALATDHWGQVYLTDQAANKIIKFSPELEPLAVFTAPQNSGRPQRLQTLFGAIKTAADAPLQWSGYNQAFLLEEWNAESGARRIELGQNVIVHSISASKELDQLHVSGKLTDPGKITISISNERNGEQHELISSWHSSGAYLLRWNRQQQREKMIEPGYYRMHLTAESTYGKKHTVELPQPFYLPLFFYEDCGNPDVLSSHVLHGQANQTNGFLPGESVLTDRQAVIYRFKNLNPSVRYEVRASYTAAGEAVEQQLLAGEESLHAPMLVGQAMLRTAWLSIPSEALADGQLEIKVAKTSGDGDASVAELWLREQDFDAHNAPAIAIEYSALPEDYAIEQNYPNPFNPSTTIEFSIPESHQGAVTLRIYNMLGQLVRELENAELTPGVYRKIWDGTDEQGMRSASGIYIYRMQAGQFAASKKLIMMK